MLVSRSLALAAALIAVLIVASACSINETDIDPLGAISVSAMDTTQSVHLEEGQVLVNGVPRATRLPAVISEVPGGEVELTVRPGLLYPARTRTVTVTPPETTHVQVNFSSDDAQAAVTIVANEPGATVVYDESLQPDLPIGQSFAIAAGEQAFSVFKDGFKTLAPALQTQELIGGQSYTFTFELEPHSTGGDTGDLFPGLTWKNDAGDSTGVPQYRGKVVLVTCWFYSCSPCREEFPYIQQTFEDRADEGFRVIGLNTGWTNDDEQKLHDIRTEIQNGLTFPLVFNHLGNDWTVEMNIMNAPTNFIIGPSGEILFRRGQITYEGLNEMIDIALDQGTEG